jgi:hypothetical protein
VIQEADVWFPDDVKASANTSDKAYDGVMRPIASRNEGNRSRGKSTPPSKSNTR